MRRDWQRRFSAFSSRQSQGQAKALPHHDGRKRAGLVRAGYDGAPRVEPNARRGPVWFFAISNRVESVFAPERRPALRVRTAKLVSQTSPTITGTTQHAGGTNMHRHGKDAGCKMHTHAPPSTPCACRAALLGSPGAPRPVGRPAAQARALGVPLPTSQALVPAAAAPRAKAQRAEHPGAGRLPPGEKAPRKAAESRGKRESLPPQAARSCRDTRQEATRR